jgi:thiol:disulfide interchange protein
MIKLLLTKESHLGVRCRPLRKKALIVVILLTGLLTDSVVPAQTTAHPEIKFFKGTWQRVLQRADRQNSPILAEVGASWCIPCRQLQQQTFKSPEIVGFLNKHFITVTWDAEKGEGIKLADLWQVNTYPTLLFFDASGKMLMRYEGFINSDSLMVLAKKIKGLSVIPKVDIQAGAD